MADAGFDVAICACACLVVMLSVSNVLAHRSPFSNEYAPKRNMHFFLSTAMAIALLYPTFYIEFTSPRHGAYLLYANSTRLQIKSLGEGMAALQ